MFMEVVASGLRCCVWFRGPAAAEAYDRPSLAVFALGVSVLLKYFGHSMYEAGWFPVQFAHFAGLF